MVVFSSMFHDIAMKAKMCENSAVIIKQFM